MVVNELGLVWTWINHRSTVSIDVEFVGSGYFEC